SVDQIEGHGEDRVRPLLGHHERPESHGKDYGHDLDRPVPQEAPPELRHALPRAASRRTPASSDRPRLGASVAFRSVVSRSRSPSGSSPRSMTPSTARGITPLSSETTTTAASVSSERPTAARWRVPNVRESPRLRDRGRKQPAAVIRSPWISAAPSWSGDPGWKTLPRSSAETTDSICTPSSA